MAGGMEAGRGVAADAGGGEHRGPQTSGGSRPSEPPADLSEIASGIADAAKEQGRTLLGAAKGQATSFADQRKESAAQAIADLATSLRSSGGGFEDRPNLQSFVGTAADGLEQLAGSLRERSVAELYGEVEAFARRQPVAVGAAAMLTGFLLARFIKSSAEDLAEASYQARNEAARTGGPGRGRARPVPPRV